MTLFTGYLLAAGAALLALIVVSGFFGPLFGFLSAGAAWYYTWKYFDDKYKVELNALLNPPPQIWAMSMPEAWVCIKDVLANAHVESGTSGISNWQIQKEDNTTGAISAQISFKQALGSPTQPLVVPRSVTMQAQLSPSGDNTQVEISYQIFSPSGNGLVESVIKKTHEVMQHRVGISKRE